MITIDELRKCFPAEVGELEMRYEQLITKRKAPNTIYKFEVFGKVYGEDVFTKNYVSFFYDMNKVLSFDQINECLGDRIVSKYPGTFISSAAIGNNFYINTKNSTDRKIIMIDKLCDHFGIRKRVIKHVEGGEVVS